MRNGQRYYVPGADTPENMALARSADRQYQANLATRAPAATASGMGAGAASAPEPAWSFRKASVALRSLQDAQAEIDYQARLNNAPNISVSPVSENNHAATRKGIEQALVLPMLTAITAPASLRYFAVGAIAGGTTNYGFQAATKSDTDWVDVGTASVTGGLTFGKGVLPSAAINATGAYANATAKGEDPTWKVAAAAFGTLLGAPVGSAAALYTRNAAIASAIRFEAPVLSSALATSSSPMNAYSSSFISETVGAGFDAYSSSRQGGLK